MASQRRLHVLYQQLAPSAGVTYAAPSSVTEEQNLVTRQLTMQQLESSNMFARQVIVITGAAKGIGEAAALQFARLGAQLLLTDLDKTAVEETAQRCRQAGSPKVATVAGDITAVDAPSSIAKAVQEHFGRLDVLVNNAGQWQDGQHDGR